MKAPRRGPRLSRSASTLGMRRTFALSALGVVTVAAAAVVPIATLSAVSPTGAGAVSTMLQFEAHGNPGSPTFTAFGNHFNAAVEPKAEVKFTCNSLTGAYTVTASNIQVIARDGVTPWDTTLASGKYSIAVYVFRGSDQLFGSFATLSQQPTELFGTNARGMLYSPSDCATRNSFITLGVTTPEANGSTAAYEYGAQGRL
jgi:hypothetical protein